MYHILVTLDSNYIPPLKVMLYSLFANNPGKKFAIHLIYAHITNEEIKDLKKYTDFFGQSLNAVYIGEEVFSDALTTMHYTKAMYYRLLAHCFLPSDIEKILYLDPDILAINPLDELYNTDLTGYLFGACAHNTPIVDYINKIRLQSTESEHYFNSGVLLINLKQGRLEIKKEAIFNYVAENEALLILPDQDVLNGLYGNRILALDDSLYNYDVRKSSSYALISGGAKKTDWVVKNTVFLHFCGKQKPWRSKYTNKFCLLYKHYQRLAGL